MATPLFIIGPQRSGTTIAVSLACRLVGVGDGPRGHEPFARWDIPFIGELGGDASHKPLLDGIRAYAGEVAEDYAAVRIALPWAWESLGWWKLLEKFPNAKFILIHRNEADSFASWRLLPYVRALQWPKHVCGAAGDTVLRESYSAWHFAVICSFTRALGDATARCVAIRYENLVLDADRALAPVCAMLGLDPLSDAQQYIRPPKHWSGDAE